MSRRASLIFAARVALSAIVCIWMACAASVLAADDDEDADRVAKKADAAAPAGTSSAALLDAAAAALRKEYAPHLKNPKTAVRQECDYFIEHPAEIPAEALVAALEKTSRADDPRTVAYVKWQLLSAAPEKFDAALIPRLVKLYEKAPRPAPRFGIAANEKAQLDTLIARARPQDDVALSAKLDEAVERIADANRPILAYRDELFARLPASYAVFAAALRDVFERNQARADAAGLMEKIGEGMRAWILSGEGTRRDRERLAEMIGELRNKPGPRVYTRASVRRGRIRWQSEALSRSEQNRLVDLQRALLRNDADAVAESPGDGPDSADRD